MIKFTRTEDMWADFNTKPLQGRLFGCMCSVIMGMHTSSSSQGCVGEQSKHAEAEVLHEATK